MTVSAPTPSIESLMLPLPPAPVGSMPPTERSAVVLTPATTPTPVDIGDATSVAGPSTAGTVMLVLLLLLAVIGAAATVRRRLDPRCRAEAMFFDRAGVSAADRRRLRRAARRLDPPVPAPSLLLSPGLLDLATRASGAAPADAAALATLARRRFGSPPADDAFAEPAAPSGEVIDAAFDPPSRRRPTVVVDAAPHRSRAVSMLAVAMTAAQERRDQSPVSGPR